MHSLSASWDVWAHFSNREEPERYSVQIGPEGILLVLEWLGRLDRVLDPEEESDGKFPNTAEILHGSLRGNWEE